MKIVQFAALGLLLTAFSHASTPAKADDIDRLSLGLGYADVFDGDDSAVDFRMEYRPGTSIIWELRPWIGAEVTSDGSLYGAAGFLYDYNMGNQWFLTPSVGAGLYAEGGGKDLGSAIEFRSQIELGYQFENQSRVSAALSHISNLDIGDENPGSEALSLYYHIPMQWVKNGPGSNGY